ncbi:MAG: hypothetical protein GWN01_08075 [Nitrosopumilaceae archaeon]|nr:hypothetical protein [Nitrosopumilaceae archaeon]NIU00876.1 hypothetical protein [Nitrosopumilaceae archaeon]NIU87329.1 hypothetical protein [Nitrosopumilaceae archaeon]NIV65857.1 hypothetical protein [Nitrosopumilaceae archaeon]NIX61478.1 hypothetical protein [Nitrosopumilaceae archaeon]
MSHTGVEVFDFLLFTVYPVIGLFVIEIIFRIIKGPKWIKLFSQGIVCIGFGIAYLSFPGDEKFPLTAVVLFALAVALFYQGKRAKISPDKTTY